MGGLVSELKFGQKRVMVYSDNQEAIFLIKNPYFHDRMKHFDVKLHFILEMMKKGKVGFGENPH